MNMENMNENTVPHQPPQPIRGEHQATVKESTDLLKKLAEFSSKKEEVLKRISSIGARMEQRIGGLPGGSTALSGEGAMPEFLKNTTAAKRMPDPFEKITYTRVRETPKPVLVEGCFNIALPNKQAITDEWKEIMCKMGDYPLKCGVVNYTDEYIALMPGGMMSIATGLKIALPQDLAFHFTSFAGLTVMAPQIFTRLQHEKELVITIKNDTDDSIRLLYGTPLFTAYPVHLANNLKCDELLNSTYEDWIHGSIAD